MDATRVQVALPAAKLPPMQWKHQRRMTVARLNAVRPGVALLMALWLAFLSTASVGARYAEPASGLAVATQGALCSLGVMGDDGEASPQTLLCPLCATAAVPIPASNAAIDLRLAPDAPAAQFSVRLASVAPPAMPPPARAPPPSPVLS